MSRNCIITPSKPGALSILVEGVPMGVPICEPSFCGDISKMRLSWGMLCLRFMFFMGRRHREMKSAPKIAQGQGRQVRQSGTPLLIAQGMVEPIWRMVEGRP